MLSTLLNLPKRLWRMSALRQSLLLTALFWIAVIGSAVYAVFEMRDAIDRRVDNRLEARFEMIRADIANGTFDTNTPQFIGLERVIYLGPNEKDSPLFGRRGTFLDDDLAPDRLFRGRYPDEPWLFLGGPAGDGWLIVGQNVGELSIFDDVLMEALVGIGWITLLVALAVGLFLGWRTKLRLSKVTAVLDRAANGDLSARVAQDQDRDDLDQLGHQVNDAIGRIAAALDQAKGFSASIAHDLKTPLTRLRIRLESALMSDGDREEEIGAALEEVDKAIAIFDAFLRLSKLESGALERRFEPVDLAALANDIAETYGPVIEDSGRSLTTDISAATLKGDPVLLGQFLTNLIQNALRHTPKGTALTIVVRKGVFGLADDGPGIPEDQRDNVVKPMYRLDRSRGTEGAGLGLALARTIALRHKAELRLSEPDTGNHGLFVRMVWPAK